MIRITVELISANGPERNRLLGIGTIANIGVTDAEDRGYSYAVSLSKMAPKERQAWKQGRATVDRDPAEIMETIVEHFDREKRGAWDLVYLALRQLVGYRNPDPVAGTPITSSRIRRVHRR